MSGKGIRVSSSLAALVVAAITLVVFFVLRDYGPESAIRRFHEAAVSQDWPTLQQVTVEPIDDVGVKRLAFGVIELERNGANYIISHMEREPNRVVADVHYTLSDGEQGTTVWVVVKTHRIWKVSSNETFQARDYLRRMLGR